MALLEVKDIHKKFGDLTVLDGVDLSVEKGDVVSVIGPSGSGKTTLLRCINFLERADKGTMEFEGREYDLHNASRREINEIRSHTGFVFQNYNLFANKTALENVTLGLTVTGKKTKAEADRIGLDLLAKVGMGNRFSYYPSQLSGGQQQRVGIARALAAGPDILYLDEPTSALDPELIGEVMEVLRLLAKSSVTMVIVTHEMRFAREVSSKVVFMDKGKVVEQADPETFFTAPEKERTREFLRLITKR